MNNNLLIMSVLTQGRVKAKVNALPASPTEGDVYLLSEAHSSKPNQIAVYDGGEWVYLGPKTGYLFYNQAQAYYERFTGSAWDSGEYAEAAQLAAQAAAESASNAAASATDAAADALAAQNSATTASSQANIATSAKDSAQTAANAANTHADTAETFANAAGASANAAQASSLNAASKADIASGAAGQASNSATAAAGSASSASTYATAAQSSATAAHNSELSAQSYFSAASDAADAASSSADAAATSATTATTQATNAGNSALAAENSALTAQSAMGDAEDAATAAVSSATAAATSETNASTQATAAQNSATAAQSSALTAASHATNAQNSATASDSSAQAAAASASTATTQATAAANSATAAEESSLSAASSLTAAQEAATETSSNATAAANSATAAHNSELSAASHVTSAQDAADASDSSAQAAASSATSAATSATAADNSATAAQNSALTAASHVTSAENAAIESQSSATAAAASATSASTSATAAGNSATAAQNSALAAGSHVITAQDAADASQSSAEAAASSATSASTSATAADNSATAAQNSALAAESYVGAAEDASTASSSSATAAAASATSASTFADAAENSALAAHNSELTAASHVTASGDFADAAETSANAASTSASNAATAAEDAGSSATAAQNSATSAATSASDAATSASNAATSAGQASTSESNAAGSAASASSHATDAANAATTAGGSATAAAASASSASTSATDASNSASSALSSSVTASSAASDAKKEIINLLPSDFQQDGAYFFSGYQGDPATRTPLIADSTRSFQTVTGVGRVLQIITSGANVDTSTIGVIKVLPDRIYQASLTHRTLTSTRNVDVYLVGLDESYNYVALAGNFVSATSNTTWATTSVKQSGNDLIAAGIAYIRVMGRSTSTGSGTNQFLGISLKDITESENAADSALAAATSATTASTAANDASLYATAAQNSATTASTASGDAASYANDAALSAGQAATSASAASTSANAASTSETNAAGSASTASTAATNAANSATSAGNSATAASNSASNAATSSTNAGASAAASETSALKAAAKNNTRGLTSNADFNSGKTDWVNANGWTSDTTDATQPLPHTFAASWNGASNVIYGSSYYQARGSVTSTVAGRKYRLKARYYVVSGSPRIIIGWSKFNPDKTFNGTWNGLDTSATTTGTWVTYDALVPDAEVANRDVAPFFLFNVDGTTATVGLDYCFLEDVTESWTAEAQATISTNAATTATTQASTATTQATLASNYASDSRINAAQMDVPSSFERDGAYWMTSFTGAPSAVTPLAASSIVTFPTVSGIGKVCQIAQASGTTYDIASIGVIQIQAGRTYKITAKFRTLANVRGVVLYLLGLNSSYTYTAVSGNNISDNATTSWKTQTLTLDGSTMLGAGIVYARVMLRVSSGTAETVQWALGKIEDVTESVTAAAQAAIATTQATNASNSAASAAVQTNLAVSYASSIASQSGLTPNANFDQGTTFWRNNWDWNETPVDISSGYFSATLQNRSNVLYPTTTSLNVLGSQLVPLVPGRHYRIRSSWNNTGTTARIYCGAAIYNTDKTPSFTNNGRWYIAAGNAIPPQNTWTEYNSTTFYLDDATNTIKNSSSGAILLDPGPTNKMAYITPLAIVSYNNEVYGIGAALDYLYIEDVTDSTNAAAQASIATSQSAIATAQASAAQQSAVLSASVTGNFLNKNAGFDDYPSGATGSLPTGWSNWSGTSSAYRVADNTGGYAFRHPSGAGANGGLLYTQTTANEINTGNYYVLEADVILNSGSFAGAALAFQPANSSGTTLQSDLLIDFETDPDTSGVAVGAGSTGKLYQFRKLVKVTAANAFGYRLYAMGHWTSAGSIAAANDITWYKAGVRPATQAEIRDQTVLTPLQSSVSTIQSAVSTLDTRTASYLTKVSAGSGTAELALYATDSGGSAASNITLKADKIKLGSITQPVLEISGGMATFTGALNVGATSGARVNITNNLIRVYDSAGTLRVRLGIW